jgi:hypothetical protein
LDGSIWLSFARHETGYLLRFPALVDFFVSTDARSVCCIKQAACPQETMRHLLLNQVIPIVLSHLGKLVLHASACATPQGVIAFLGMTGTGKSTLAASFGRQGFPVLTDDCLLINKRNGMITAAPSYPGLRLWPETVAALFDRETVLQPLAHYTDKKRLLLNQRHFDGSLAIRAIFVLRHLENKQKQKNVTITPLVTSEAFLAIVKHTFQLDITDRDQLGRAFRKYEWLVNSIPFFRLDFPREYAFLPSVNLANLNHLANYQDRKQIQDQSYIVRKKHVV